MNSFNKSIRDCFETLEQLDFLAQAGPCNSLRASDDFKKTSLKSQNYREVYDAGVRNQDFNIMLSEHSFFQFTLEENNDIRLAYYPNPYRFVEYIKYKRDALSLLDDNEITQEEYFQFLSEGDFTCDIPAIRYDYSLEQYCKDYHPAAHFHIGFYAENRWPTNRLLTPHAFLLKTLKHYYLGVWIEEAQKNGNTMDDHLDKKYRKEVFECPKLDEEAFSKEESERFYIT
ncbi:DUF2290 domain-containing protein [Chromohalobacter israelensis]|uniref:DUF2290 domain-containing protein n=1 Tax=Chromohalobacter israelensis TaxID=141390 RepID=UPI000FFF5869|nr:DUF2290 domain-containing protein [Chromohalobacter salexigens]RXE47295.1 hypothetical protein B4O83_04515 [Chromohalobacter salexigens]